MTTSTFEDQASEQSIGALLGAVALGDRQG